VTATVAVAIATASRRMRSIAGLFDPVGEDDAGGEEAGVRDGGRHAEGAAGELHVGEDEAATVSRSARRSRRLRTPIYACATTGTNSTAATVPSGRRSMAT